MDNWDFDPDDPEEPASEDDLEDDSQLTEQPDEAPIRPDVVLRRPRKDLNRHHDLDPSLRMLYTSIAFAKLAGTSAAITDLTLNSATTALELEKGDYLENRTGKIKTALSRLGADPDKYIQRFVVCPNFECWEMVPYEKLYEIASPKCQACDANIYKAINNVRKPHKVIPYSKLSTFLAHLYDDPVYARRHEWRTAPEDLDPEQEDGLEPRHPRSKLVESDVILEGLSHGTAWRSMATGIERVVGPDFEVTERPIATQEVARFSSLNHGLFIILNCDWLVLFLDSSRYSPADNSRPPGSR